MSIRLTHELPAIEHSETISDWELESIPYTISSASLLDDCLETSARMYHKAVADLQKNTQETMQNKLKELIAQGNAFLKQNPTFDTDKLVGSINESYLKFREHLRGQVRFVIAHILKERMERDDKIRLYLNGKW